MTGWVRSIGLVVLAVMLIGCGGAPVVRHPSPNELSAGYSLLYELVSKQSQADQVLIIKGPSEPVAALIREIAAVSGEATERLEGFAEADEALRLDTPDLPRLEQATREAIERTSRGEILWSGGERFEKRFLLVQARGLRYGAHLARAIAAAEEDAERSDWLAGFADRYAALRNRAAGMLTVAAEPATSDGGPDHEGGDEGSDASQ